MLITLKSGNATVKVSPVGAAVERYTICKEDIFYRQRTVKDVIVGGSFPCAPFLPRPIRDFSPKVDWLQDEPMKLMRRTSNKVSFQVLNKKTPTFPWVLQYDVDVELVSQGCLTTKLTMKRIYDYEKTLAPINPCFFPYFPSLGKDYSVEIGGNKYAHFSNIPLEVPFKNNALIKTAKQTILMFTAGDFTADSRYCLWTNSAEYFCVKPKMTPLNSYADTKRGKFLDKGESVTMECYFCPLP